MEAKFGVLISAVAILFSGCATNAYQKFYHDELGGRKLSEIPNALPCDGPLELFTVSTESIDEAQHEMSRNGYVRIGWSGFVGDSRLVSEDALRQQASAVGACAVLSSSKFLGSSTSSIPLTLPSTTTSITNSNATAYGSGGSATGYGTARTTTYGTQTTYIPVHTSTHEGGAGFFVKRKHQFGLLLADAEPSEAQKIGRNGVFRIATVVRGTPAFSSDLLEGDFVTEIDGRRFGSTQEIFDYVKTKLGNEIVVTVYRSGEIISKSVALGL